MASSPITLWQIGGETMERLTDFIFLISKITADGDCCHEIKRHLLLGRKSMTNLDSILKSRDDFADKGPSTQSYGFSNSHVWMWELDHKPELWRIYSFELWCWRRLLRAPWTAKKLKPVNLKGNQSWIFAEWADVEAKAPIFWPPDVKNWQHWKRPWCWEGLKVGGDGAEREWDGWMASPTQWAWVWASSGSWWWTGKPNLLQSVGSEMVGNDWVTELNWTLLW